MEKKVKVVWDYMGIGLSKIERVNAGTREAYKFYGHGGEWAGSLITHTTKEMVKALAEDLGYVLIDRETLNKLLT